MVEGLKELALVFKDLPDTALWILFGFLFYKLAITGSIVGSICVVAKLLINKVHDAKTAPQVVKKEFTLESMAITSDGTYDYLITFLRTIVRSGAGINSKYLHREDVEFLIRAFEEKIKNDKKNGIKNQYTNFDV